MHMVVGGYTLGSIGVEIMIANNEAASPSVTYIPPQPELPPPSRPALPAPPREPFRYASWDDEETR